MSDPVTTALLATILGEEAAAYAYGVAAPRLGATRGDLARGGLVAHRLRVIALRQRLPDGDQPPAAAGFTAEVPVDEASAAAFLSGVESRLAAVYADLAAVETAEARAEAVRSARECAVRAIAWGGTPEAFPGR